MTTGYASLDGFPSADQSRVRDGIEDQSADPDDSQSEPRMMFKCHKHELSFKTQADLTNHYVCDHWGVTPDRIKHP